MERFVVATKIDDGKWEGITLNTVRKERAEVDWDATSAATLASQIADAVSKAP